MVTTPQPSSDVPSVDPAGARALLEEGAVLLDVREDDEWDAGHAPDATHVPLGDLAAAHERGDLPSDDRRIVAVCRSGGRSAAATQALRGAGYDAVNLEGGMRAWASTGLPVVTDAGGPGAVV